MAVFFFSHSFDGGGNLMTYAGQCQQMTGMAVSLARKAAMLSHCRLDERFVGPKD
jgi:hypothetical protein